MPKETDRTKRIRLTILELKSGGKDLNERQLRQACFGKLAENDADEKEKQRLKDSIRRIVSQMQASGEWTPAKRTATRKTGNTTREGGEETANAAAPSDALPPFPEKERENAGEAPLPSSPDTEKTDDPLFKANAPVQAVPTEEKREEPRPIVRMPKAKQMNEFLSAALKEDAPEREETLVGRAVAFFGVSGEQVNGVRGLVIQCLMDQKKNGTVLFDRNVGYRRAPAVPAKEPAPHAPAKEPSAKDLAAPSSPVRGENALRQTSALPQVQVKRIGGRSAVKIARKSETETKRGQSRPVLNENRFAERINAAGGARFTEFIARLFEEYYRSRNLTVCGRYVVDGADDKGVDVILQTVDELGLGDVVLLQAKTRSSGQVTLKELREFYGVMAAEHADHGLFVTTATFTTDAVSFVRSHPDLAAVDKYKLFSLASRLKIGLIDGEDGVLSVDSELFG